MLPRGLARKKSRSSKVRYCGRSQRRHCSRRSARLFRVTPHLSGLPPWLHHALRFWIFGSPATHLYNVRMPGPVSPLRLSSGDSSWLRGRFFRPVAIRYFHLHRVFDSHVFLYHSDTDRAKVLRFCWVQTSTPRFCDLFFDVVTSTPIFSFP